MLVTLIQKYHKRSLMMISFQEQEVDELKFYRLSDAWFYKYHISIYQTFLGE